MKIREGFKGIFCLPVTPFTKDDEIDEEALRTIVDVIIEDGADGLVAPGLTGEFPFLLHEERKKIYEIVLDQANGRVPVLAGTGATNTKEALIFTKYAEDIGCDGVMLSNPVLHYGATDAQSYSYYERIATKVNIPILVYNNPGYGQSMSPDVIERLATDFDNIVSYKEDDFSFDRFAEIIRRCKDKITIFTGSPTALLTFLTLGAHGPLVAQFQAFPHLIKGVYESFQKGDMEKTLEFHEKIMEVENAIWKLFKGASFPAVFKAILKIRGVDLELAVRHPSVPVTEEQLKKAEPELLKLGIPKIN